MARPVQAAALCAALFSAGTPGAVAAGVVELDLGRTEICVDGAMGRRGKVQCIGTAATQCAVGAARIGAIGLAPGCIEAERIYWARRMDRVYRQLRSLRKADDALAGPRPGAGQRFEALRAMQRAWFAWRDTTCASEGLRWGGPQGSAQAATVCLMRLTGEQALYLEEMAARY